MKKAESLVTDIRAEIFEIVRAVERLALKVTAAEEAGIYLDWKEGALSEEVIIDQLTLNRATVTVDL